MKIKCILDQVKEDWKSIGYKQGFEIGANQARKSLIIQFLQHFGIVVPKHVIDRINNINDSTVLKRLVESALNAKSLDQFVKDLP